MKLTLVRHGETQWNEAGRFQGSSDIEMSAKGVQQAIVTGNLLKDQPVDFIYSSDMKRAITSANEIRKHHQNTPLLVEPNLREMDFGVWEGLSRQSIIAAYPEMYNRWKQDRNQPPRSGESLSVFEERVRLFWHKVLKQHIDQDGIIVAHGGTLRLLICIALEIPSVTRWHMKLDPCSISLLEYHNEEVQLHYLNSKTHLSNNILI